MESLIERAWLRLEKNKNYCLSLIDLCKTKISIGGGVLWVKYDTDNEDEKPMFMFCEKNGELWNKFKLTDNINKMFDGYDCQKHYIIYLSSCVDGKKVGQMVQMNYSDTYIDSNHNNYSDEENKIWRFKMT